ncbi:MAG: sulfite exporter TauE/SafE family protein [Ardenticatenaceae bacterium]
MFIGVILIGLLVGTMIGTVGIGGVLLAPALSLLLGLDLQLAMATSMWSFLFTGMMGAYSYGKKGSIEWSMVGWLALGIIPATILGARTNVSLSPTVLASILATVILYSGVNALLRQSEPDGSRAEIAPLWLILIGVIVGFGSALTGTGGAVMLMPIFLLLHVPALKAVGVVQGIQLPISIFASLGFVLFGEIDFVLGSTLGIVEAMGVLIGAQLAHRVPARKLRQLAACALILSAFMLVRQIFV